MSRAVVIPCSGAKLPGAAPAGELYVGSWHRLARAAADQLVEHAGGRVLILSALHGVLQLDDAIEPYEQTMKDVRQGEGEPRFAGRVRAQLDELGVSSIVGLVPGAYFRVLFAAGVQAGIPVEWPLRGCAGVGYQRQALVRLRDRGV